MYKVEDLIVDPKARKLFVVWEKMNHFCSVKTEKIKLCSVLSIKKGEKFQSRERDKAVVRSVKDTNSTKGKDNESTAEKEQETV